jgi:hypothetical protein
MVESFQTDTTKAVTAADALVAANQNSTLKMEAANFLRTTGTFLPD